MIHVIASIKIKVGQLDEFIELFKANVPNVLKEEGCIEYLPTIDLETVLPPQLIEPHVLTVIEKWESLDALYAHLNAPHMLKFKEDAKDLIESISLKILSKA